MELPVEVLLVLENVKVSKIESHCFSRLLGIWIVYTVTLRTFVDYTKVIDGEFD